MTNTNTDHFYVNDRVLWALQLATRPLTADNIAVRVFRDDPNGGPEAADQAVRYSIYALREAGHRIAARLGRRGGYTYLGFDDPAETSPNAVHGRREQVTILHEMGRTIPYIAARLGLPPRIVREDIKTLGLGRGWSGIQSAGRAA